MPVVSAEALKNYRSQSFRTQPGLRVHTVDEAVRFVQERGFIFFWPMKEMPFPSLWAANAGDRPVPDEHDDPGHVTWDWKDKMLGKHRWYYGRVLRKRNAMLSLEAMPYFYTLTENYGSPEEDYLLQYDEGRLTQEAKLVYEALLREGPLDTINLRKSARLASSDSTARFNKAITDLQADFKILPIGVSDSGAWHYAHIYDTVHHHFPDLPEQARFITEPGARARLAEYFFRALGAARPAVLGRMFGWNSEHVQRTIQTLVKKGVLVENVEIEGQPGHAYAVTDLLH